MKKVKRIHQTKARKKVSKRRSKRVQSMLPGHAQPLLLPRSSEGQMYREMLPAFLASMFIRRKV